MSQELSLVLAQPVEQLVPLLIKWNNEELMREVELRLARFEGVTYTAEQVGEAKKEKAALNAFIKALNDERIRIGKVYATPMDKFKGEVDEVISRVKSVVEGIDVQLRAYEETRIAEKQEKILEYFKGVIGDFSGLIPYERIHNPKWLNASVRDAAVFAEIDKIIADATSAITAIEALHSEDEATLKAYYFRTLDLGAALMEHDRLKTERARIAEMQARKEAEAKARAEAEAKSTTPVTVVEPIPEVPAPAASAPATTTLDFRVEATVEQLKALRDFLISNGIKFYKI